MFTCKAIAKNTLLHHSLYYLFAPQTRSLPLLQLAPSRWNYLDHDGRGVHELLRRTFGRPCMPPRISDWLQLTRSAGTASDHSLVVHSITVLRILLRFVLWTQKLASNPLASWFNLQNANQLPGSVPWLLEASPTDTKTGFAHSIDEQMSGTYRANPAFLLR